MRTKLLGGSLQANMLGCRLLDALGVNGTRCLPGEQTTNKGLVLAAGCTCGYSASHGGGARNALAWPWDCAIAKAVTTSDSGLADRGPNAGRRRLAMQGCNARGLGSSGLRRLGRGAGASKHALGVKRCAVQGRPLLVLAVLGRFGGHCKALHTPRAPRRIFSHSMGHLNLPFELFIPSLILGIPLRLRWVHSRTKPGLLNLLWRLLWLSWPSWLRPRRPLLIPSSKAHASIPMPRGCLVRHLWSFRLPGQSPLCSVRVVLGADVSCVTTRGVQCCCIR